MIKINNILQLITFVVMGYSSAFGNVLDRSNNGVDEYFAEVKEKYKTIEVFVEKTSEWDTGLIKDKFKDLELSYSVLKDLRNEYLKDYSSETEKTFMINYARYNALFEHIDYVRQSIDAFYKKREEYEEDYHHTCRICRRGCRNPGRRG